MKKPKDIAELANRLAAAASTPLVSPVAAPGPVVAAVAEPVAPAPAPPAERKKAAALAAPAARRKAPSRTTVPVFLRISQDLYERYDGEAVRRTKATGRGVTVQQVILDKLIGAEAGASA